MLLTTSITTSERFLRQVQRSCAVFSQICTFIVWVFVPGMVTTFLGQAIQNADGGSFADGVGNSVGMNTPNGLTIDSTGSSLLFADMDNLRIRKSNSAG